MSSPGSQRVRYSKRPEKQLGKNGKESGQGAKQLQQTDKYFPTIQNRLKSEIKLTPKMRAVLTGHGMTKAYLHRFQLSEDAKCKCGNEYQSMDRIIFHCEEINDKRELLKQKMGKWPASKEDLKTKYKKEFCEFIESKIGRAHV